jgi:hypothetical protein
VPLRGLRDPRVRPRVRAGHLDLRHQVVFLAHQPFYGGEQVREGDEEHANAFGQASGSFWLGEDDPVVVYDVVGCEFLEELDLCR